jgi:hypothetical protein
MLGSNSCGVGEGNSKFEPHVSPATFCFLTRCSIATRVSAIGVKHFQDDMSDNWMGNEGVISTETCGVMKHSQNLSIMNLSMRT